MKILNLSILLVACFVLFSESTFAFDSWDLPKKRTTCSKNGKFCLEVIPKKLESQLSYFEDKVEGKNNAGADKSKKKNYCRGVFFAQRPNGSKQRMWETRLVNEVSPVSVLVSDEGDYVITFDNWHGVGYGDDVVAIYKASDGSLIRKFGLSEFLTDSDIDALPSSVSSIWWGQDHWIDSPKQQLVLKVTKGKRTFEETADFFEIRADLASGNILDEKRDRLPSLRFIIQATDEEFSAPASTAESDECFNRSNTITVASSTLLRRALKTEAPPYPPVARAVRAGGKVRVQIVVRAEGNVECARAVLGHPLLRATIVRAVSGWVFEKAEQPYLGYITFEGKYTLVDANGQEIKEN